MGTFLVTDAGRDFYLNPVFLRSISCLLHLVLLAFLSMNWLWKKIQASQSEISRQAIKRKNKSGRMLMFCCLAVSGFYVMLYGWNYFHWYRNKWADEKLVTLSDLGLRAVAWLGICIYLHVKFSNHGDQQLPFLLRTWWSVYFGISCYCLAIDIIFFRKDGHFPVKYLVSDVGSVVMGLFFCCVGFLEKRGEDTLLEQPLLNENGKVNDGEEDRSKSSAGEIKSPYSSAGILSFLTFFWMGSLISLGNKKVLDLVDIPQLDAGDRVSGVFPVFKNNLEFNENNSSKLTSLKLVTALIISMWRDILFTAILGFSCTIATYVGPYLIDTFVQYLTGRREFKNEGYVLVSAIFLGKLTECLTKQLGWFKLQQMGIRIRAVLVGSIYNKGLTLSCKSKNGQTSGEIVNFITVDAERIGEYSWYIHRPWLVLLQITLGMFVLYKNLGIGAVAALSATVLVMLANFPVMEMQEKFQKEQMKSRDKRMKATSEILRDMRILKLQGWEMKFLHKIIELRKIETGWLKKFLYTMSVSNLFFWGAPAFVSVATFGTCMLAGIPLESGKILSALATIGILQEPIYSLPDLIAMIIQTKVSVDRIVSFLHLDDLEVDVVQRLPQESSLTAIEITNGNFSWDLSSPYQTLTDIDLKVFCGMRVAICGAVGSGKSSLLSCILGEMPKRSGIIRLSGRKAYVAQSPWIQSGKIEENILFGKEMDREKYERVLEVCSLRTDLEVLSFGDQTVIGERGINLSGGQKQRIQIARALYQDADIYLLDDPFSAVDAHTSTHLFKECLLGQLDSKTVIYVTHQVEFLPAADLILVMKDGRIVQSGKYDDILNSGTDFIELIGAHRKALSVLDSIEARQTSEETGLCKENGKDVQSADSIVQNEEKEEVQNQKANDDAEQKRQIIQEEERQKGKVEFSVYWKYMTTAYRGALLPLILLAQGFFQILQVGSNYWIAWATPETPDMEPPISGSKLIIVYSALAVGSSFCVLARSALVAIAGYKTATLLFHKMHLCIFRAPMSFFDATPSGRIINRASSDQGVIDFSFPFQLGGFSFGVIQLLAVVVIMSQIAWQVFIVFIPVVAASIWYQQYYINAAREIARLVGICKAPVIQHFAETISGSTTIRSFDQQSRFLETNMELMDVYSRPKFHAAGALGWLCFRLDIMSSMTFAFALVFLISIPAGITDPSIAGLAVVYGLSLNSLQVWVIWNLCTVENNVISVERIYQYSTIPSEPPLVIEGNKVDDSWPSRGDVEMHDLQVRYAPHMPLVLRGLTGTFRGGEKTGIVGRTGSGKSTLIQTLFRIVDPSAGQITIDGIDISSIGLHDLRSRLSIIPQDPTMFEGTVRTNLDPLEEYTDGQIWEALEKCQLGDEVRKKEGKLDFKVTENGENWSMGQRQLVCLGRVLLKRSKVLVLDEATASVDTATDNLIQQTLRQHFTDSTVITIAHRITSVLDSERVLVLDQGLIVEYDSPSNLLQNNASYFSQLVAEYTARSNSGF